MNPQLEPTNLNDFAHFGQYRQEVFSACFWLSCFYDDTIKKYGFDVPIKSVIKLDGGHLIYKKSVANKVRLDALGMIHKQDFDCFESYKNDALDSYQKGIVFIKSFDANDMSAASFKKFLMFPKKMTAYWLFSAGHLNVSFEQILADELVAQQISNIDVSLLIPKPHTPLFDQQHRLRDLQVLVGTKTIDEIKQDINLYNTIESFRKEFAWIEFTNWIGEELTLERLYSQIVNSKPAVDEHSDIVLPASVRRIVTCMGNIIWAKQAGAEYMAMYEYYAQPYLHNIAKHLHISFAELLRLTHNEIADALEHGTNVITIVNQQNRCDMKWIILSDDNNNAEIIDDVDTVQKVAAVVIPKASNDHELRGQIGNKGVYTGIVKVVMTSKDFNKLNDGDVLVTTMTTPDFVVLMQKAGAIVTDVGGMLCHAAIVSRELNKPCVIGTKFATQLLKDEDVVTVDAFTGVIVKK